MKQHHKTADLLGTISAKIQSLHCRAQCRLCVDFAGSVFSEPEQYLSAHENSFRALQYVYFKYVCY